MATFDKMIIKTIRSECSVYKTPESILELLNEAFGFFL